MREYVSFCSFPNTGQHLRAPDLASPFCARPVVCSIMVVKECASRHEGPDKVRNHMRLDYGYNWLLRNNIAFHITNEHQHRLGPST